MRARCTVQVGALRHPCDRLPDGLGDTLGDAAGFGGFSPKQTLKALKCRWSPPTAETLPLPLAKRLLTAMNVSSYKRSFATDGPTRRVLGAARTKQPVGFKTLYLVLDGLKGHALRYDRPRTTAWKKYEDRVEALRRDLYAWINAAPRRCTGDTLGNTFGGYGWATGMKVAVYNEEALDHWSLRGVYAASMLLKHNREMPGLLRALHALHRGGRGSEQHLLGNVIAPETRLVRVA